MDHATIWRKMADKWFEIAQETAHPALRKCYRNKALRFRAMAAMAEHGEPDVNACEKIETVRRDWRRSMNPAQNGRQTRPVNKTDPHEIPGTPIFDGAMAQKAYTLNKMCYSFNSGANREAFRADEDGYCRKFGLNDAERDAVRRRDVLALVEAGGNIYYLAKLAGIWGLGVQDIGAQQTGMSVANFKAKLEAAGR